MASAVIYESQDRIGIIKLNRPQVLNAINDELIDDFLAALEAARKDEKTRVIILKGEGRAFCSGADLKEGVKPRSLEDYSGHLLRIQDIERAILNLGKPLIAAVQGYALGGGCEFALNCDIRIAAEGAKFGFPETRVGATVTTAGTKLLPLVVGVGRAKEMLFTAEMIEAKQALEWGLVNKVVPLEELDKAARELAEKIAGNYPLALKLTRATVDYGLGASLEDVLNYETQASCISFASAERQTGMKEAQKK